MAQNISNPPSNIPDAVQWLINNLQILNGRVNKISNSSGGSGTVTTDTTLIGNGSSGSPLGFNVTPVDPTLGYFLGLSNAGMKWVPPIRTTDGSLNIVIPNPSLTQTWGVNINTANANTWSVNQLVSIANIQTGNALGLEIINPTPSTDAHDIQNSPSLKLSGTASNGSGGSSHKYTFEQWTNPSDGFWVWELDALLDDGGRTNVFNIDNSGNIATANTGSLIVGSGGIELSGGGIDNNTPTTTVNGSVSGSIVWSQPERGSGYKKVVIHCASLNGTATFNFSASFIAAPAIVVTNGLATGTVTSLSTSAATLTGSGVATTGWIILEGF